MASPSDFPGNLSTNTYILHDFSEIAYIVCTGAIPAVQDNAGSIQDVNTQQSMLARLRNAEQQFHKAAILVVLDAQKLELFTFYKKVDIVKDQKTVLTKFGLVCKQNHCIIAYKNACRITDLLKRENARVAKLFTAAVVSSLHLQTSSGIPAVRIGTEIHLLQSYEATSKELSPLDGPQSRWRLHRADLQILAGGQLLLAFRNAKWPPLMAMTDLIDPEVPQDLYVTGSTLYLAPIGQLARYTGKWTISLREEQEIAARYSKLDYHQYTYQWRWLRKVRDWLISKHKDLTPIDDGAIWVEAEIPMLWASDSEEPEMKTLAWKKIYWPASLTCVFVNSSHAATLVSEPPNQDDPLMVARDWFVRGAAKFRQKMSNHKEQLDHEHGFDSGRLFDDDVHFDSPQQMMSVPMQSFAQAQSVYPTPPEGMNTQPTPGFSVDGAAQTPATFSQMQMPAFQSSPLATMTDLDTVPMHEQAIKNFLQHNDDDDDDDADGDDLFDDIDEPKSRQRSFAHEPDWDFFNTENLEHEVKYQSPAPKESQQEHEVDHGEEASNSKNTAQPDSSPLADIMAEKHIAVVRINTPERVLDASEIHRDNAAGSEALDKPLWIQRKSCETDEELIEAQADLAREASFIAESQATKRRRSSAYDFSLHEDQPRDSKYSANGKYFFKLSRSGEATTNQYPVPTPSGRRYSSSSGVSLSSGSQPDDGELENKLPDLKPWTVYNPVSPESRELPLVDDNVDTSGCDEEIHQLLEAMSKASGLEPFTTFVPAQMHNALPPQQNQERIVMVVQILTEQFTQSSLLRSWECLRLPVTAQSVAFDVTVDSAGSNMPLVSASLGDLTAIQTTNLQARTGTRMWPVAHGKVRLRQADNNITAELAITNFWNVLGLQPVSSAKDVLAVCLYPQGENYQQGCDTFLTRIGETYSSCNLGRHKRASLKDLSQTGLVPWHAFSDLSRICQKIGEALAGVDKLQECIIVYVIIPNDDLSLCFNLCNAFVELFEALNRSRKSEGSDIVLQLIPGSFVVDEHSLIIPPEKQYFDLALEVYYRIPSTDDASPAVSCGPAAVLEEAVSQNLHFELSSTITSPLSKHGQCCHVAYCVSQDCKWLVATWSDIVGEISLSTSYCLTNDNNISIRPRTDIFRHILETSIGIMGRQRGKWWLALAKVGFYELDEQQDWLFLCKTINEEHKSLVRVVLLNVELQSRLSLNGSASALKQYQSSSQHAAHPLNTPVSTPQAVNTTTPDQVVPVTPTTASGFAASAQTPPDNNVDTGADSETTLTDPLEDSWAVVLGFGLNQSHGFLDMRSAVVSGFLLKRTALQGNTETHIATMGVNLIAIPQKTPGTLSLSECEHILQDILTQYRGLHTVGVARRCIDARGNCVPWHIASAYKGARILEQLI